MLMHSIREMCAPRSLVIRDWSGPEEIDAEKRWLKPLLGCVVYQAMDDGMIKVRIGVDRASGEPFMKYFGPIDYDPEKQIWWDMVPAPSECYPGMLQVCLSLAELDQGLPIKGVIPATKNRRRLNLRLAVEEMESFEIAWDEEYASNQSGERAVIDLPGSEGEEADDSDRDGANGEDTDRGVIR